MIKNPQNFFLIDPYIQDECGHFLVYDNNVLKAVNKIGINPILCCNYLTKDNLDGSIAVRKIFEHSGYGNKLIGVNKGYDFTAPCKFAKTLINFLLNEAKENDAIFIPHISDPYLAELNRQLKKLLDFPKINLHIFIREQYIDKKNDKNCFRINSKTIIKNVTNFILNIGIAVKFISSNKKNDRIQELHELKQNNKLKACFYYTDTKEIANQHKNLFGLNFTILPIPLEIKVEEDIKINSNKPIEVVYLGDAREEKGFNQLPNIIWQLKKQIEDQKISFKIQINIKGKRKDIAKTHQKLIKLSQQSLVTLLDKTLNEKEYQTLIKRSDIIWNLYDKKAYEYRSSQIFTEALSFGKVPLTLKGSSMANLLPENSNWICDAWESCVQNFVEIVNDWENNLLLAKKLSKKFRDQNRSDKLVEILLKTSAPEAKLMA